MEANFFAKIPPSSALAGSVGISIMTEAITRAAIWTSDIEGIEATFPRTCSTSKSSCSTLDSGTEIAVS